MDLLNLHQALANLQTQMLPYVNQMISISRAIAAIAALLYISFRIVRHLSQSTPVQVFPLLRPFAIGICIMLFPTLILGTIQGILSGVGQLTHNLVEQQLAELDTLNEQQKLLENSLLQHSANKAYVVDNIAFDQEIQQLGLSPEDLLVFTQLHLEKQMYQAKQSLMDQFIEILALFFHAASLCIDVIRTFILIVLAILGPLCFALSIFDGLQGSLTQWFARYISVYLWLPIAHIFSAIIAKSQTLIIENQLDSIVGSTQGAYSYNTLNAVFMLVGIVGYCSIPTVSSWVVQSFSTSNFTSNLYQTTVRTSAVVQSTASRLTRAVFK